jgi:hypothetical protein
MIMAYRNIFPTGYQPYYQPTQTSGITWVQGEAGAKSYLVAPNNTVTLWDSEAQVIYLKTADASGLPSMKILDYTIRDNDLSGTTGKRYSDFITKDDVEDIKKSIDALSLQIQLLTEKGEKEDE